MADAIVMLALFLASAGIWMIAAGCREAVRCRAAWDEHDRAKLLVEIEEWMKQQR